MIKNKMINSDFTGWLLLQAPVHDMTAMPQVFGSDKITILLSLALQSSLNQI